MKDINFVYHDFVLSNKVDYVFEEHFNIWPDFCKEIQMTGAILPEHIDNRIFHKYSIIGFVTNWSMGLCPVSYQVESGEEIENFEKIRAEAERCEIDYFLDPWRFPGKAGRPCKVRVVFKK